MRTISARFAAWAAVVVLGAMASAGTAAISSAPAPGTAPSSAAGAGGGAGGSATFSTLTEARLARRVEWDKARVTGATGVRASGSGASEVMEITAGADGAVSLVVLESPAITSTVYGFAGWVRYGGIPAEKPAYLEMWTQFPEGSRFFSRTLEATGPMQRIRGSSEWRAFCVPFVNLAGMPAPSRMELNLVLPAGGTVWLGPTGLVEFPESAVTVSGRLKQEPAEEAAGLLGAFARPAVGRSYVWVAMTALLAALAAIPVGVLLVRRKRAKLAEMRRMQAMDAP